VPSCSRVQKFPQLAVAGGLAFLIQLPQLGIQSAEVGLRLVIVEAAIAFHGSAYVTGSGAMGGGLLCAVSSQLFVVSDALPPVRSCLVSKSL
jgi:hypothetical protein